MDNPTPTTTKFHALVDHIFQNPGVLAVAFVKAYDETPLVYLGLKDEPTPSVRPFDAAKMSGENRETAIVQLGTTRISIYPIDTTHTLVIYTRIGDPIGKSLVRLAKRFKTKYDKMSGGGA